MLYYVSPISGLTTLQPHVKENERYVCLINNIRSVQGEI